MKDEIAEMPHKRHYMAFKVELTGRRGKEAIVSRPGNQQWNDDE
jgi:hypothetical protein